jgi:hypothetical protein
LLKGHLKEMEGPHEREGQHHPHAWWKVMCLTGVDYFSTLGYQPGIAALAAGALSPVATLILVLLTLCGALPIYSRVAQESHHGEGSISMLEHLLSRWKGKLFVLALLGFVATDFIITITLSATDATAHIVENPFVHQLFEVQGWNVESDLWAVGITLVLVAFLGAIFLKGFKEAIGIAVLLVAAYLLLNMIVVGRGLFEVATHPDFLSDWTGRLMRAEAHGWRVNGNVFLMVGISLLLFPKLALGLSGFETGVAVMPLVKGDPEDTHEDPQGRVRNTRKLLLTAVLFIAARMERGRRSSPPCWRPSASTSSSSRRSARYTSPSPRTGSRSRPSCSRPSSPGSSPRARGAGPKRPRQADWRSSGSTKSCAMPSSARATPRRCARARG